MKKTNFKKPTLKSHKRNKLQPILLLLIAIDIFILLFIAAQTFFSLKPLPIIKNTSIPYLINSKTSDQSYETDTTVTQQELIPDSIRSYESPAFTACKTSPGSQLTGAPSVCLTADGKTVFNLLEKPYQEWVEYSNTDIPISLKYPKYDPILRRLTNTLVKEDHFKIEFVESEMSFAYFKNKNSHDWYEENKRSEWTDLEQTSVNSYPGYTFTVKSDIADSHYYLIPTKTYLIVVSVTLNKDLEAEILSSLKLTTD